MAPTLENRDVQYLNSTWKEGARLWGVDRKMLHCITGGISFDIVIHQYRWLETEAGKEMEQERGQAWNATVSQQYGPSHVCCWHGLLPRHQNLWQLLH